MAIQVRVKIGERWYAVQVEDLDANPAQVLVNGETVEVAVEALPAPLIPKLEAPADDTQAPTPPRRPVAAKAFRTPMPGMIISVAVKEGDQVITGDEVCVLEAMKMQQNLRAEWSGIVVAVHVRPGQQVRDGEVLVELE